MPNMPQKDILRHFRAAPWRTQPEMAAFVAEVGVPAPPGTLSKLLPMLLERGLTTDLHPHRARCGVFAMLAERSASPELGQELFIPGVRALRQADQAVRGVLVHVLPRVNDVAGHAELAQTLSAPDVEVRRAAGEILRLVGGRTAFEVIEQLVRQPGFPGRIEALDVMVPKASHHTVPLLAATLKLGRTDEKLHALKHLADTKAMAKALRAALEVAATAVRDPDPTVVTQAIQTMAALATEDEFFEVLGDSVDTPNPATAMAVVRGLSRYKSPRALAVLGRRFREGPSSVSQAVLDALEAMGSEEVLPLLVEALGHKQILVRSRAAAIVSKLSLDGKVDVARSILWLLRSRDTNIRRIAVEIANKVGDPRGDLAPRLMRFLRDEDWWVRERVMDALVEMQGQGLTRHIVSYLEDPSDVTRRFAIGALARLKDPKSLGALVRTAQNDTDWWAREQAVETLAAIGDPRASPYLIDLLGRRAELRLACLNALRVLRAQEAAAPVAETLMDEDADVRLAAIACLAELDARAQNLWLKSCENDPVVAVRNAARDLLQRWAQGPSRPGAVAAGSGPRPMRGTLDALLLDMHEAEAEDLVVASGRVPYVKKLGKVVPLGDEVLSAEGVRALFQPHLTPTQRAALENRRDVDFSYEVKTHELRFRANLFHSFTGLGAVFRAIKNIIPEVKDLGLPPIVGTFGNLKNGLVLVGGPTGSGKSTTLAAIIDSINRTSSRHIITIEDPIEVVHTGKKCLINQREVGTHAKSFDDALRSTLREDPDVILVGEMRDLDTISFAITASETGHLVFGTVHTVSADTSIDRLVNAFPPLEQPQVRSLLAETLRAVVCQQLLRRKDAPGRVAAIEVMLNNDAVSNMIRKGKTFQIPQVVTTSREQGMQSMDQELIRLVKEGKVSSEDGYMRAIDKKIFEAATTSTVAGPTGVGAGAAQRQAVR